MATISVVTVTNNAQDIISDCLESAKWADELIVLDLGSTDNSVELAKKYTDKVFSADAGQASGRLWNEAISKASSEWVFVLESDKRISDALRAEIQEAIGKDGACGYGAATRNYFLGKWLNACGLYPDEKLYLFKRGMAKFQEREGGILGLKGETLRLKNDVDHYVFRTIEQSVEKIDHQSSLIADELKASGADFKTRFLITKPFRAFKKCYFKQGGRKEGIHGLLYCGLIALRSFLIYAKRWEAK